MCVEDGVQQLLLGVFNSSFRHNVASKGGGAIYMGAPYSTLYVADSSFSYNKASKEYDGYSDSGVSFSPHGAQLMIMTDDADDCSYPQHPTPPLLLHLVRRSIVFDFELHRNGVEFEFRQEFCL